MLKLSKIAASLILLLNSPAPLSQLPQADYPAMPSGWSVYPSDQVNSVTPACLSSSPLAWRVSVEGNALTIVEYKLSEPEQPTLPPEFKLKPEWLRGRRHLLRLADGWLIGIDAGEFGGGLWITNDDGSLSRQIVIDNVRGIVPTSGGIVVLSGLAHMGMDFGNVVMLSDPHGMQFSFEWQSHLISAPESFVKLADGSILVATKHSVWKISPSGKIDNVHRLNRLRGYYSWTNSIVETTDGTIYLGSRAIVVRLRPGSSEEWLVPTKCLTQNLCGCKP
jgi:hypothetical protein